MTLGWVNDDSSFLGELWDVFPSSEWMMSSSCRKQYINLLFLSIKAKLISIYPSESNRATLWDGGWRQDPAALQREGLVSAQHCNHFKVGFIDEHKAPSITRYLLTDWHWQMTTAVLPWVAGWRHARRAPYAEGRGQICGPSGKSGGEERDRCFCGWFCKPRGISLCCCQHRGWDCRVMCLHQD